MILDMAALQTVVDTARRAEQKVVFTNGCFDLLHLGHVRYLREARGFGDLLIVGLNSDASVRKLKGPNHPLIPAKERAEVLDALRYVDHVVIFEEDTPEMLIRAIRPDVHVKGGDYSGRPLPEEAAVRESGGQIRIAAKVPGRGTTQIIDAILERFSS